MNKKEISGGKIEIKDINKIYPSVSSSSSSSLSSSSSSSSSSSLPSSTLEYKKKEINIMQNNKSEEKEENKTMECFDCLIEDNNNNKYPNEKPCKKHVYNPFINTPIWHCFLEGEKTRENYISQYYEKMTIEKSGNKYIIGIGKERINYETDDIDVLNWIIEKNLHISVRDYVRNEMINEFKKKKESYFLNNEYNTCSEEECIISRKIIEENIDEAKTQMEMNCLLKMKILYLQSLKLFILSNMRDSKKLYLTRLNNMTSINATIQLPIFWKMEGKRKVLIEPFKSMTYINFKIYNDTYTNLPNLNNIQRIMAIVSNPIAYLLLDSGMECLMAIQLDLHNPKNKKEEPFCDVKLFWRKSLELIKKEFEEFKDMLFPNLFKEIKYYNVGDEAILNAYYLLKKT